MARGGRTFIDRFIDKYWLVNITRIEERKDRKFTISQIDQKVHNLIHLLFLKSEDDQTLVHQVHMEANMIHHQALINAIKDQIKPGLFKQHTQSFTPEMLKVYFNKLQKANVEEGMHRIRNKLKENFGFTFVDSIR